ncbi:MAG: phosphotransferase [Erysipelotrichaceae bacterium]
MEFTIEQIRGIIEEQFPEYESYKITQVLPGGHDNRTFKIGEELTIRIPSNIGYVKQVAKEYKYLPLLAKSLKVDIVTPIELGKRTELSPYPFTINKWIEGKTLGDSTIVDKESIAVELNQFLKELQKAPLVEGLGCGIENCYRGCSLDVYDLEARQAIQRVMWFLPADRLLNVWNDAIKSIDIRKSWMHGDMSVNNILIENDKLKAVIDFGQVGIGDPSCDYVLAWTYFSGKSREFFLITLIQKRLNALKVGHYGKR